MNIDDLIQDLRTFNGISERYATAIQQNQTIRRHIESNHFGSVFYAMVKFLEPVKHKLGLKYVKTYTTVPTSKKPKGCENYVLTFAQPKNKTGHFNNGWKADNTRWIARMQLHSDANPVLIYFPKEIIVQTNAKSFISEKHFDENLKKDFEYEILKQDAFEDFCKKPDDFISMKEIKDRLNRV